MKNTGKCITIYFTAAILLLSFITTTSGQSFLKTGAVLKYSINIDTLDAGTMKIDVVKASEKGYELKTGIKLITPRGNADMESKTSFDKDFIPLSYILDFDGGSPSIGVLTCKFDQTVEDSIKVNVNMDLDSRDPIVNEVSYTDDFYLIDNSMFDQAMLAGVKFLKLGKDKVTADAFIPQLASRNSAKMKCILSKKDDEKVKSGKSTYDCFHIFLGLGPSGADIWFEKGTLKPIKLYVPSAKFLVLLN